MTGQQPTPQARPSGHQQKQEEAHPSPGPHRRDRPGMRCTTAHHITGTDPTLWHHGQRPVVRTRSCLSGWAWLRSGRRPPRKSVRHDTFSSMKSRTRNRGFRRTPKH